MRMCATLAVAANSAENGYLGMVDCGDKETVQESNV